MYIAISKQSSGLNYNGSVADFVNYLEKENEGKDIELQEHFFDQYNDRVSPQHVIKSIDSNTGRLSKKDPKFYSIVVSPSARELNHIANDPDKLKMYVRQIMKDYAASFHRETPVTVDDIMYYAKLEHERTFKGTDKQIVENQPYATKILELKHEIRSIEEGRKNGNIKKLKLKIDRLEAAAPHQQNGKRIVQGMAKEGYQSHIHIIVSRMDKTNSFSVSPGSAYKESTTKLNGKKVYRGFNRDKFLKAAEKTFDKTFGYNRNFVESYKAKKLFQKDSKKFFFLLTGLSKSEKQVAFSMLGKAGVKIPKIPLNKAKLALKAFKKLQKGVKRAMQSGSIDI